MPRQRHETRLDPPITSVFAALIDVVARGRWGAAHIVLVRAATAPGLRIRAAKTQGAAPRQGARALAARDAHARGETLLDRPCRVKLRLKWRLEPLETSSCVLLEAKYTLNGAASLRRRHWDEQIHGHCTRMLGALRPQIAAAQRAAQCSAAGARPQHRCMSSGSSRASARAETDSRSHDSQAEKRDGVTQSRSIVVILGSTALLCRLAARRHERRRIAREAARKDSPRCESARVLQGLGGRCHGETGRRGRRPHRLLRRQSAHALRALREALRPPHATAPVRRRSRCCSQRRGRRPDSNRNLVLQRVGDTSLFVAGFFRTRSRASSSTSTTTSRWAEPHTGRLSESVRGTYAAARSRGVFAELAEIPRVRGRARRDPGFGARADDLRHPAPLRGVAENRQPACRALLRSHGIEPNTTLDAATRH